MKPKKPRLYVAAPLFNEMERQFNRSLADQLARRFDVFLPQSDGLLMVDLIRDGMPHEQAKMVVFTKDIEAIRHSDVLLAVLNGRSIDEGVAFELGVAYALGKTCWGLKTDMRQLLAVGDNPMIEGAIKTLFRSEQELLCHAAGELDTLQCRPHRRNHNAQHRGRGRKTRFLIGART